MHRKITVKALTLVFFLFSIAIFANDDKKTTQEETHQTASSASCSGIALLLLPQDLWAIEIP